MAFGVRLGATVAAIWKALNRESRRHLIFMMLYLHSQQASRQHAADFSSAIRLFSISIRKKAQQKLSIFARQRCLTNCDVKTY
jgi:hypothetical protein